MLRNEAPLVGQPISRVDGRLKVTGAALYAAEYPTQDLLHGYIVPATIARGRIKRLDVAVAKAFPGVVDVFTHETRQHVSWWDRDWQDETASPGHPFRPLHSDRVLFDGQPIALVVAETFEAARDAAALVEIEYAADVPLTDIKIAAQKRYDPPKKRSGIPPAPKPRGEPDDAFEAAPAKVRSEFFLPTEHHNPMELFASTVVWEGEGKLTIYDKTQGSQNSQDYVVSVFGLKPDDVKVVNAFVGGAFGAGLRPRHQLFLAVMASLTLKRSVRVELSRQDMFYLSYRPTMLQTVSLGADREGRLQAVLHDAVAGTSDFEDYQENVVNWSGMAYHCDNAKLSYNLAKIDTDTPGDMRAPGATSGVYALEVAMDELAYATGIDPLELRERNFSTKDENEDKPYTSKALHSCYREGAEMFGWAQRSATPRSMREGRELIGWGMSSGFWEAQVTETAAAAKLTIDGRLDVKTASSDIGTGTYTILTMIGADAFGLPLEAVTARIGDSSLPKTPVQGGSWTAASSGTAVMKACQAVQETLLGYAGRLTNSPIKGAKPNEVEFRDGRILLLTDPSRSVSIREAMQQAGVTEIEENGSAAPDKAVVSNYASYTHSAIFVEVRVDEELGVARVTRVVNAVAAGKILNPKTARSQILGGVVMGIGMALHEEGLFDHRTGRIMNHNLAEYHVPAHADVEQIDVIFVSEHDDKTSPLGVKGLGEIGIVGTAAAIGNAIFHATGKRIRDLPITIDKIIT